MQDKIGPRLVASIGGILVGAGMIFASYSSTVTGYVIGFGCLAGAGLGFGYASATPPAVKWFPPEKTGLIAGIVVSGFGLASVYAAPLADYLANTYGLQRMMMSFGVAFLIIVVGLAQFLKAPAKAMQFVKGLGPVGTIKKEMSEVKKEAAKVKKEDFRPAEMLKTWQFHVIWFMYACGAGAGLMVISSCKTIAGGMTAAVVGLAIGNGLGRVLAGMISDKMGRNRTMLLFFLLQAGAIFGLSIASAQENPSSALLIGLASLVGANYGSNLSLFPSITKDYFGLKNFGVNYGLVFTAWGIGGLTLSQFAAKVYAGKIVEEWGGSYNFAFYASIVLLVFAGILTFVVKAPQHEEA
jgi:OFA family oxalate/formate antiporter-like MFS transporter